MALVVTVQGPNHPTLEADLERAVQGLHFGQKAFHRAVELVARKCEPSLDAVAFRRTYGDGRGVIALIGSWFEKDICFFWQEGRKIRVQVLDRPGDQGWLDRDYYFKGSSLRAAGSGYANGNWTWPTMYSFQLVKGRWEPAQILVSDDEGGVSFARKEGKLDPDRVVGSVRVPPQHLGTYHAGPHLQYDLEWKFKDGQFVQTKRRRWNTPLAAQDDLTQLVIARKRACFDRRVPSRLQSRLWEILQEKGEYTDGPSVGNVGNVANDLANRFSLNRKWIIGLNRSRGAWRVCQIAKERK